jgi:putative transposase
MAFWRLYYHLVWATRDRAHLIKPEIEAHLYAYIVHKASEIGVYVYAIDGWYDHSHVVASLPPKLAVADVVKQLKGASSHHMNQVLNLDEKFGWQRGYGALSLGERQRAQAEAYVRDQKAHHTQQTANAWLERYTELDEGPPDMGLAVKEIPYVLREDEPVYDVDIPF